MKTLQAVIACSLGLSVVGMHVVTHAHDVPLLTSMARTHVFTDCKVPRPEICYEIYAPVCAVVQIEGMVMKKEYSNDCTACSDPVVTGYEMGHCKEKIH